MCIAHWTCHLQGSLPAFSLLMKVHACAADAICTCICSCNRDTAIMYVLDAPCLCMASCQQQPFGTESWAESGCVALLPPDILMWKKGPEEGPCSACMPRRQIRADQRGCQSHVWSLQALLAATLYRASLCFALLCMSWREDLAGR